MQGFTARIKYRKNGLVRFIGHLDTTRALLRAFRRAGIEGVYSEGFSPRLRVSFGPPLPLGCTSECEYLDVKIAQRTEPETMKEKIQSRLPQGLCIEEVRVLEGTPPPLQASIWAAEYEIGQGDAAPLNPDRLEGLISAEGDRAAGFQDENASGKGPGERLLRASLYDNGTGRKVLSVVLREGGRGGRLREVLGNLLGLETGETEKLRIHKKRVYLKGENV
jgi:radical SAM-linked protein